MWIEKKKLTYIENKHFILLAKQTVWIVLKHKSNWSTMIHFFQH